MVNFIMQEKIIYKKQSVIMLKISIDSNMKKACNKNGKPANST